MGGLFLSLDDLDVAEALKCDTKSSPVSSPVPMRLRIAARGNFNRVALVGDEVGDAIGAARERTEHERVCALATGQKVDVSAAFEPVGTFSANEAVGTGIAEHDVVAFT